MTNEESIGSKIIKVFSNEEIIPQHFSVSNKRNYYYLPKHKLAIKIDEFGHMDIDKITNKKRQDILEKHLGCTLFRINPDAKQFDIFIELGKIRNYIEELNIRLTKESTKKS